MSPSEIAFLAVGLVIGAAIGAAISEALRAGPAPRRHVRVTISPNSVSPRRPVTLAESTPSPDDPAATRAEARSSSPSPSQGPVDDAGRPAGPGDAQRPVDRTPVPMPPAGVPPNAVAIPVARDGSVPVGPGRAVPAPSPGASVAAPASAASAPAPDPGSRSAAPPPARPQAASPALVPDRPTALGVRISAAIGVLDPIAPLTAEEEVRLAASPASAVALSRPLVAVLDVGERRPVAAVRPRPPRADPLSPEVAPIPPGMPVMRPRDAVPVVPVAVPVRVLAPLPPRTPADTAIVWSRAAGRLVRRAADEPVTGPFAVAPRAEDPCAPARSLVDERCALASAARERAREAAEALRDAQRAYDELRERVDEAERDADPREVATAKDELHRRFRRANDDARGADEAERAAREWLDAINELNAHVREATRRLDAGNAELRAALPRLDRLAIEVDAARSSAEAADAACHESRERLAACEEDLAGDGGSAAPPPASPTAVHAPLTDPSEEAAAVEVPRVLRVLRGDRVAEERLVAALADPSAADGDVWRGRVAALLDAIVERAIEDGYLDLPDDDAFWGPFTFGERRDIVAALSALGYRFDGTDGFTDGRVPAARDLSLAVGYAGLDRMRIRAWPRDAELERLFARATVAADEWLADQADDLSLGRMVDALGARAAALADVWNAWGRVRPALLAID